jgi:glutathione S-transferase
MSLKFYFSPMSTASITELVIEELGIPCERIKLDLKAGDTKKPEFLAINPNGKVPTIVHDGTAVWESSAITMYLGETFGVAKNLYPAAGPKRADVMKWLCWTHVTLGEAVYRFARNTMDWTPEDQRNAKAGETAKNDVQECLRIFDRSMEGKAFLTGNDFTIADAHINSFMDWLRHMKVDFAAHGHLNAWSKRCSERPAYKKLMATMGG